MLKNTLKLGLWMLRGSPEGAVGLFYIY